MNFTGRYNPKVVQRSPRYAQGRFMRQIFLLWALLTSWPTSTAAQASAASTPQPCGGTLIGSGIIRSPNYPLNNPNKTQCSWRLFSISNDTGIIIQFSFFALGNYYDHITIKDERNNSKRYFGGMKPHMIFAGKEAIIEFYSEKVVAMRGFAASFSSINVTSPYLCRTSDTYWCARSKKCISRNWLCDKYPDCTFNEDELSCPTTAPTTTRSPQSECLWLGKFWCSRSVQCIPMLNRCNGNKDCVYGEDESCTIKNITPITGIYIPSAQDVCRVNGKFWCSRSNRCIPTSYKCDNFSHCEFGEDEASCSTLQQQCAKRRDFWCGASRKCISSSLICNYANDCDNGEDEAGCSERSRKKTTILIVVASVSGFAMLLGPAVAAMRATAMHRQQQAPATSNDSLPITVRPSATVSSTSATYASQFRTSDRKYPQGTGGLPLDQDPQPSNESPV